jgi:YidC/Oxa1 family membrane protein insertase
MLYTKVVNADRSPEYIIGLRSESKAITPGETVSFHSEFYVGPKLQDHLGEIAKGLELVTNYGIFTVISKPLFLVTKMVPFVVGKLGLVNHCADCPH